VAEDNSLCMQHLLHNIFLALNPKPETVYNSQPSTINPQPSTLNPQPSTLNPQPENVHPTPHALKPKPEPLVLRLPRK
jgi:hypothetical protein